MKFHKEKLKCQLIKTKVGQREKQTALVKKAKNETANSRIFLYMDNYM